MMRGAEVITLGSAIEALEEMERRPFDVLVSDIGMPEMDGYQLIREVRARASVQGKSMPAVALTDQYSGSGLGNTWTLHDKRSAFVGTF